MPKQPWTVKASPWYLRAMLAIWIGLIILGVADTGLGGLFGGALYGGMWVIGLTAVGMLTITAVEFGQTLYKKWQR